MGKRFYFLLGLLMVLAILPYSKVAAQGEKYILSTGETSVGFNDADSLIEAINNIEAGKAYTLTLNDDLELSKVLNIKNDFKIIGKDKSVKIKPSASFTERFMITVDTQNGPNTININNLTIDGNGQKNCFINYEFSDGNFDYSDDYKLPPEKAKLALDGCEIRNFKSRYTLNVISTEWINFAMRNCKIIDNTKEENNPHGNPLLIWSYRCNNIVENCEISNNIETNVMVLAGGLAEIKNTHFSNNKGDCLDLSFLDKLTMEDGSFKENEGSSSGAFKLNFIEDATIKNVNCVNNKGQDDGAITVTSVFLWGNEPIRKLNIDNCQFIGNKGKDSGAIRFITPSHRPAKLAGFTPSMRQAQEVPKFMSVDDVIIQNSKFINNEAVMAGAVNIGLHHDIKVKNTEFNNNRADENLSESKDYLLMGGGSSKTTTVSGGAIRCVGSKLTIDDSQFINNYASRLGGAIYYTFPVKKYLPYSGPGSMEDQGEGETNKVVDETKNLEFLEIYSDPQELVYKDPKPVRGIEYTYHAYKMLKVNDDVVFSGNRAGYGFYNPPKNYKDFKDLKFKQSSLEGKLAIEQPDKTWTNVRSILNNYDVNYLNPVTTTIYDGNDVAKGLFAEPVYTSKLSEYLFWDDHNPYNWEEVIKVKVGAIIKERDVKILTYGETKLPNQDRALPNWNSEANMSGDKYVDNQNYKLKGNLYIFAKQRAEQPAKRREPDLNLVPVVPPTEHRTYIFGYPDGSVKPNGQITRAEAAAMVARLLEIESKASEEKPNFPDTPSAWYNKTINAVVEKGIMKGYPDGMFRPNAPITRGELTQMIATFDNKPEGTAPFPDILNHWAERPIGKEYQGGRISGYPDGTFRPNKDITRCEVAVILNNMFDRKFDSHSLSTCKNPNGLKMFTDLLPDFWGYDDMVEATNTHDYIRRENGKVEENWLEIKKH